MAIIIILISLSHISCYDHNPAIATFTGDLVYSYIQKDTAYSEYVKIVDRAGLKGMLSAYGYYTCFAPNNQAFRKFYRRKGPKFNIDSLTKGQIDTLAATHIIPGKFLTINLSDGVISNTNMNGRYIEVKFDAETSKIILNDSSNIIFKDIEVYNGVVNGIDHILQPSDLQLPDLMMKDTTISIFYQALELTRLSDSLRLVLDANYHPTKELYDEYNTYKIINPAEKKYGYTAFVESNSVLRQKGVRSLSDLIEKAKTFYPEATDPNFMSSNNSLNKFMSYHLLKKAVYKGKFFFTRNTLKNFYPDEYLETILKNRIIRVSHISDVNSDTQLNGTSNFVANILKFEGGKTTINGVYHIIDNFLVYSEGYSGSVEDMLVHTRIRLDMVSQFPEMASNDIRASENKMALYGLNSGVSDRYGFEPGYLTGITFNKDTRLIYLASKQGEWRNYQADEFMGLGAYDLTIRIMPVPPGTWEIRFGYTSNGNRSITQLYIDGKPVGIPLDLRVDSSDPSIGYVSDSQTDDSGYENDKAMRNRGYMKYPNTISMDYGTSVMRDNSSALRRIVGQFTFTEYGSHTLRFRTVTSNTTSQCMMDFMEIVPKSIYNSPDGEPEDRK